MKISCVLFDFDGTLADTLPLVFKGMKQVFKNFDQSEHSTEDIIAMFGPTEEQIIRTRLSNPNIEAAVEEFYRIYKDEHAKFVPKSLEIEQLLQHLKQKGIKTGIITGKGRKSLEYSLEILGLDAIFDITVTGDDVEIPKPHPEGILKALQVLDAKAEESIFIGDSDADILAGKTAGIRTIGVQWLSTYQTSTFSTEPDQLFSSVDEFLAYLFSIIQN